MDVILRQDDREFVDGEKRIGVAIFAYDGSFDLEDEEAFDDYLRNADCIERVYGDSEDSALTIAKEVCKENNYAIVVA